MEEKDWEVYWLFDPANVTKAWHLGKEEVRSGVYSLHFRSPPKHKNLSKLKKVGPKFCL